MASIFSKWKEGLAKTSRATFGQIATVLGATEITPETWDELEALLIRSDLGVETTESVLDALEKRVDQEGLTRSQQLQAALRAELRALDRWPAPIERAPRAPDPISI